MAITQYGYHETLVDFYVDDLDGAITAGDTSITVSDATGLPTQGYFRLQIESEIIVFNGRSGNVLNATERGAEGTTAATHADATAVTCVLTAGGLQRFLLDGRATAYTEEASPNACPLQRILDDSNNVLTVSSFTWVNQGSASASDDSGMIKLTVPDEASINLRGLFRTPPATPYRVTAAFRIAQAPGDYSASDSTHVGLAFRRTGTGAITTASVRYGQAMAMWHWTSPTAFSVVVDTNMNYHESPRQWIRIEDDGTDIKAFFSQDGNNWTQDGSAWWQVGRAALGGGAPDQIGFYINSGNNSGNSGTGTAVATAILEAFRIEGL